MRSLSALAAVIIALGMGAPALAAEQAVGFAAGGTSGAGFSYRYFGDSGFGVQLTGFFVRSTGSTYASVGVQALAAIQEVGFGRLYGVAGVGYYQGLSPLVGVGPGIEIGGKRGAALAFELPLVSFQGSVLPIPNVSYLFKF